MINDHGQRIGRQDRRPQRGHVGRTPRPKRHRRGGAVQTAPGDQHHCRSDRRFDDRVARRDRQAAGLATPAQDEPAEDRPVLSPAQFRVTKRAMRAAPNAAAARHPPSDDVEKTADRRADEEEPADHQYVDRPRGNEIPEAEEPFGSRLPSGHADDIAGGQRGEQQEHREPTEGSRMRAKSPTPPTRCDQFGVPLFKPASSKPGRPAFLRGLYVKPTGPAGNGRRGAWTSIGNQPTRDMVW